MTKGERLIWQLFEMVRELMPVTAANTERFQKWSEVFHEMEHGGPETDPSRSAAPEKQADEPEEHEDPHEHGSPTRRRRK